MTRWWAMVSDQATGGAGQAGEDDGAPPQARSRQSAERHPDERWEEAQPPSLRVGVVATPFGAAASLAIGF